MPAVEMRLTPTAAARNEVLGGTAQGGAEAFAGRDDFDRLMQAKLTRQTPAKTGGSFASNPPASSPPMPELAMRVAPTPAARNEVLAAAQEGAEASAGRDDLDRLVPPKLTRQTPAKTGGSSARNLSPGNASVRNSAPKTAGDATAVVSANQSGNESSAERTEDSNTPPTTANDGPSSDSNLLPMEADAVESTPPSLTLPTVLFGAWLEPTDLAAAASQAAMPAPAATAVPTPEVPGTSATTISSSYDRSATPASKPDPANLSAPVAAAILLSRPRVVWPTAPIAIKTEPVSEAQSLAAPVGPPAEIPKIETAKMPSTTAFEPVADPAASSAPDPSAASTDSVPTPPSPQSRPSDTADTFLPPPTAATETGTGVATTVLEMKNQLKAPKVAEPDVKVLPVDDDADTQGNNLPPINLVTPVRPAETRGSDLDFSFANGSSQPLATDNVAAATLVDLPSLTEARMRSLERTQDMMALHATRLVESTSNTLSVVIKPAVGVELSLELSQRSGVVEAQATLTRGDHQFLSQHWPELQQRLEQRGIRLAPLGDDAGFTAGDQRQFQQSQSSEEDAAQRASAFAEFAALGSAAVGGASARLAVIHDGWESWA